MFPKIIMAGAALGMLAEPGMLIRSTGAATPYSARPKGFRKPGRYIPAGPRRNVPAGKR